MDYGLFLVDHDMVDSLFMKADKCVSNCINCAITDTDMNLQTSMHFSR